MVADGPATCPGNARYLILIKHSLPAIDPALPASRWTLSAEGRRRCPPLAEALRPWAPPVIVSSMEPKALETASLVAAHLGVPYAPHAGLHEHDRETAGFLTEGGFRNAVKQFFAQPDNLVFGRETARHAHDRFIMAVRQAEARQEHQTVAIVAHGTVIALFVAHAAGIDPFPLWQQLGLPSFVVLNKSTDAVAELRPVI